MLSLKNRARLLAVVLIPAVVLIMGTATQSVWADDPECFFNIEFNATDLDVGVRGFFDYEPWTALNIYGPPSLTNRQLADIDALNNLALQGFAEWFFESGEPTLADVSFATFLSRFPEGNYDFDSNPTNWPVLGNEDCTAEFTHVIPCAPEISASGNRGLGTIISWEEVTQVVDTVATDEEGVVVCEDSEDLEIIGYKVIVEIELGDDEVVKIFDVDLLADDSSVHVPPEFIALSDEFEYEVLAIEASGNQTITEDEFCVNETNGQVEECEEENGE